MGGTGNSQATSTRETQGERRNAGSTPANMRECHNMKTLSAISRKAYSNVLSLAAAQAQQRDLSPPVAVPRQDVRISGGYLSAGFAWPKSAPGHRSKGGTGADLRKERRKGDRLQAHSTLNPRRIRQKSVNETVARLLADA